MLGSDLLISRSSFVGYYTFATMSSAERATRS